jgi:tetratricopeptide (TPR) repeat protein
MSRGRVHRYSLSTAIVRQAGRVGVQAGALAIGVVPTMRSLAVLLGLVVTVAAMSAQTNSTRINGIDEPPELTGEPKKVTQASEADRQMYEILKNNFKDESDIRAVLPKLDDFLNRFADYSDGYFLRATCEACILNSRDFASITSDVNKAMSLTGEIYNVTDYYSLLGKVALARGEYQQAIDDLDKAMRRDLDAADRMFNIEGVKPEKTSPKFCIWTLGDLDVLIAKFPNDYRPRLFRGLYYEFFTTFNETYYQNATQEFQSAAALNPKSPLPRYFLGEIHTKASFWTKKAWSSDRDRDEAVREALQPYTRAIQLDSKFLLAYRKRASAYLNLKQYPQAIKDFDKVLDLDPENYSAYCDRGVANLDSGQYFAAISDFGDAIRRANPGDTFLSDLYQDRGDANVKLGQYREAILDYSKAIERRLANDSYLMNLRQFRSLYPEYDSVTDEAVGRKINALFWPEFNYEIIAKNLRENKDYAIGFLLSELYEKRGDAYLNARDFKRGVLDFNRIFKGIPDSAGSTERWRSLGKSADGDEIFLDVKSAEFPNNAPFTLWLKFKEKKESQKIEYEIDCKGRLMNEASAISYDSTGKVSDSSEIAGGWKRVIPDTVGEQIFSGACSSVH